MSASVKPDVLGLQHVRDMTLGQAQRVEVGHLVTALAVDLDQARHGGLLFADGIRRDALPRRRRAGGAAAGRAGDATTLRAPVDAPAGPMPAKNRRQFSGTEAGSRRYAS